MTMWSYNHNGFFSMWLPIALVARRWRSRRRRRATSPGIRDNGPDDKARITQINSLFFSRARVEEP